MWNTMIMSLDDNCHMMMIWSHHIDKMLPHIRHRSLLTRRDLSWLLGQNFTLSQRKIKWEERHGPAQYCTAASPLTSVMSELQSYTWVIPRLETEILSLSRPTFRWETQRQSTIITSGYGTKVNIALGQGKDKKMLLQNPNWQGKQTQCPNKNV